MDTVSGGEVYNASVAWFLVETDSRGKGTYLKRVGLELRRLGARTTWSLKHVMKSSWHIALTTTATSNATTTTTTTITTTTATTTTTESYKLLRDSVRRCCIDQPERSCDNSLPDVLNGCVCKDPLP